jgi:hypothetical protein
MDINNTDRLQLGRRSRVRSTDVPLWEILTDIECCGGLFETIDPADENSRYRR